MNNNILHNFSAQNSKSGSLETGFAWLLLCPMPARPTPSCITGHVALHYKCLPVLIRTRNSNIVYHLRVYNIAYFVSCHSDTHLGRPYHAGFGIRIKGLVSHARMGIGDTLLVCLSTVCPSVCFRTPLTLGPVITIGT